MSQSSSVLNQKIGVLGGGQLGRMLIQSAINLNLELHMLDPDPQAPCCQIAASFTTGKLTDYQTVVNWGKNFDIITIEIENVNVEALLELERQGKRVYPQPHIIKLIQDKRTQKQFHKDKGIPTADFHLTENAESVRQYTNFLPAVHKLGTEGYDGRGVQMLRTEADLPKAFDKPGVLEKLVDFEKELAVIIARNELGQEVAYPPVEMVFHPEHNLVEFLLSPARIAPDLAEKAKAVALKVGRELGIVGILAVEMFLTPEGEILVNEVAPRPHNSGHHSIEANGCSQYEQHLRAILNLPLGNTDTTATAAMANILGEAGYTGPARYKGLQEVLQEPNVYIHLYGKTTTKPFRKMGHVTITATKGESSEALLNRAKQIKETLKVVSD
jgi:5-(carboxyamino)imidazole ribonucleotide synthase